MMSINIAKKAMCGHLNALQLSISVHQRCSDV